MDPTNFDRIAKGFAARRLSRRRAVAQGGVGLAASVFVAAGLNRPGAAQEATPVAAEPFDPSRKRSYLFVQSFQAGDIAAKEGEEGRYTVTLEHGFGQTVYFADRPSRDAGAVPTAQFLEGLGFVEDNPPNAALVVETGQGETDIAVVELFNPHYDPDGASVTYEVEVLANWQDALDMDFTEAPTDLAALAPSFGPAHLFIDDCADYGVACCSQWDNFSLQCLAPFVGGWSPMGYCYNWAWASCLPCEPYYHDVPNCRGGCNPVYDYWDKKCNASFGECNGICHAIFWTNAEIGVPAGG